MKQNQLPLRIGLTILPIVLSLAVTAVLVIAIGKDPMEVATATWEGAFRNAGTVAGVFNFWIPLTLACLGLIITFSAGLWNIGVEGQMTMGAIWASWAARTFVLPSPALIGVELLLAAAGGAFWASLVGFLRVRLGVNEIFGGVALNSLASVIAIYLISGPWTPAQGGSAQATDPFPVYSLLPEISTEFPVSLLMLILVIVAVVLVALALRGTRWGLQLRAAGKNPRSALLLGIPTTRVAMSAFIACGALAGLGGAYRVLFTFDSLRPSPAGGIGFLALLMALVIGSRAIIVPFIGFAFAAILVGSTRLRLAMQLDQSVAEVIQGFVVLFVLMGNGLRARLTSSMSESEGATTRDPAPLPAPETTPKVVS
jgi:general nucleoside transport system permease protein